MNSRTLARWLAGGAAVGLVVACGWLWPRRAGADAEGIIYDATTTAKTNNADPGFTFSHTVAGGTNRYLVVAYGLYDSDTVASVAYGGSGMTNLGTTQNIMDCIAGIYGLANPATGANNVVITLNSGTMTTPIVVSATSLIGVSTTLGATSSAQGTGTSVSPAEVTTLPGRYVVDSVCFNATGGDTSLAADSPEINLRIERLDDVNTTGNLVHAGSSTQPACTGSGAPGAACTGGASTPMAWTIGASRNYASFVQALRKATTSAVGFDALDAARDGARVHIGWRTGFEVDNLGFILYREVNGARVRITPGLIAGSALTAGQGVSLRAGRSYSWVDQSAVAGGSLRYWLEEIDLAGKRTMRGPVTPARSVASAAFPDLVRLGVAGKPGAAAGTGSGDVRLLAADGQPIAHIARAQDGHAAYRVKFHINREGVYRVTQEQLASAGFDSGANASSLRLTREGKEVPFMVNSSGGVEFFATGADFAWTNEGVYWLDAGDAGKRIPVRPVLEATGDEASTFRSSAEVCERSNYFGALLNGDKDNFFGAMVSKTEIEIPVRIESIDFTQPAAIEVSLQGVSSVPHRVQIKVNGNAATLEVGFDGTKTGYIANGLAAGVLTEGKNTIALAGLAGDADVTMVDRINLSYARKYESTGGRLRFSATGGHRVSLSGFTTGTVRVFDITDAGAVEEITAEVSGPGAGRLIKVVPPGTGGRTLLAVTDDRVPPPRAIRGDSPSSLAGPSAGADLVIISHQDFKGSLAPLRALRESEGLTVAEVDVEDIYDEFSYGQTSPYAIRAFIAHARTQWQHPPRFVLLVGDASFDPKNNLGKGNWDFVPTKFVDVGTLAAAVDDWFVTPEGNPFADIAIGRLPVRTPEEANAVVAKIVAFRQGQGRERAAFLYADQPGVEDFEAGAKTIGNDLAGTLKVSLLFRRQAAMETRAKLLASLGKGPLIAGYLGHGSEDQWAGQVLTTTDVANLANHGRPSLYLPMTCLNNYFTNVYQTGLGKALMLSPEGGAIAVWGSSAMADASRQVNLNRAFLSQLTGASRTLGEAILKAKVAARDPEIHQSWILLGDPSTQMPLTARAASDAGITQGGTGATSGGNGETNGAGRGCSCMVGETGGRQSIAAALPGLLWLGLMRFGVRCRRRNRPSAKHGQADIH